jgi:hypothetical protein
VNIIIELAKARPIIIWATPFKLSIALIVNRLMPLNSEGSSV